MMHIIALADYRRQNVMLFLVDETLSVIFQCSILNRDIKNVYCNLRNTPCPEKKVPLNFLP